MQAWESFVEEQLHKLGAETANKWLKTLKVLQYDAGNLHLEAKDTFHAMWFEEHMRQEVAVRLFNNNKRRIKVHLTVANAPTPKRDPKKKSVVKESVPSFSLTFEELDPFCTLANFAVFESNLLIHKIFAQLCSDKTSLGAVNPIYIHGSSGTGKTHLLMACVDALRKQGLNVIYTNAQTFTDHVVSAIRAGEMSIFRQSYRNGHVLIIDDVHVLSNKGATQEEFFHTFNTLHMDNKQIILSANCAPGELQNIEPRLTSRFEWGLVHGLEMPSIPELGQILSAKAHAMDFVLHPKITEYLLATFSTPKMVIKAFEMIVLRSHMEGLKGPLSVIAAAQMVEDLLDEERKNALTQQKVVQGVAEFYGIRSEDIMGKSQTRDCVLPRQISMHICRHQLKLPFVKIAQLFGKDHSTVMTSVKVVQKGIDNDDEEIAGSYRIILKRLRP